MLLPSTLGAFSTTAISDRLCAISSKICLLLFMCAISLPRNLRVSFTLSPLVRNFLAAPILVFRSLVSILGGKSDLLDIDDLLLLLCFLLFSHLLVFVLTVIHDLTNRRLCRRSNLHQVESGFLCHLQGISGRNDSKLFSVFSNQSYFFVSDLFINH